jgi:hypothetical protein
MILFLLYNIYMYYHKKYLKYKGKYLELKYGGNGGDGGDEKNIIPNENSLYIDLDKDQCTYDNNKLNCSISVNDSIITKLNKLNENIIKK